jgi:intracellular multiplication protein IcmK
VVKSWVNLIPTDSGVFLLIIRSLFPGKKTLRLAVTVGALISMSWAAEAAQTGSTTADSQSGGTNYVGTVSITAAPPPQQLPTNLVPANPAPIVPNLVEPIPTTTKNGAVIPPPPPPSNLAVNASDLAAQAEQAALQAQADADAAQMQRHELYRRKSFERAELGVLPLSSDQIRAFMHRFEDTQRAAQPPYEGTPRGQVRISTLSLDPGTEAPQVNLAAGYVTTINMLDASGEPWPILDVGIGGNFEVSPTAAGTHVVRVMPLTHVGTGDLSVLLKDLPTPVIFKLNAGGPSVDLRFDARVPKFGPNAKMPLVDHPHIVAGNESIMMMLENAPPGEARSMKVSGLDTRTKAWMLGEHVYVRTPLTLLSPSWNASVSSADGMTVYEIGDAPVLLMSDNGAVLRAHLSREDDHDK